MKRRILALSVTAAAAAAGCADLRQVAAALRDTSGFRASADPRVFYEPGAERLTAAAVAAVPGAVTRVEETLGGPFTIPVRIYLCATLESYTRFTGSDRSGGDTTAAKRIFISPKPENTPERVPAVVAHELTHLHVVQRLGFWRMGGIPSWFGEGLAAFVSGGGGAEGVSDADAARAIRAGRHLVPGYARGPTASTFGLTPHMFYRQGAMFIGYLKDRDGRAFARFLAGVEAGTGFQRAFETAYAADVGALWSAFAAQLPVPP
jgi:hypothetical protein